MTDQKTTASPETQTHADTFEALAQKIEKADRHVNGGPWCDSYEPVENRDYFAFMVREFAKRAPPPETHLRGDRDG